MKRGHITPHTPERMRAATPEELRAELHTAICSEETLRLRYVAAVEYRARIAICLELALRPGGS